MVRETDKPLIDITKPFPMRAPCKRCGHELGIVREAGGNNVVRCASCDAFGGYSIPKRETGQSQRRVKQRESLAPERRAFILERDHHRCALCGHSPMDDGVFLVVAHILSVKEGQDIGATESEIMDDANLFACCEACNAGQGSRSLEPLLVLRLIRARLSRNGFTP